MGGKSYGHEEFTRGRSRGFWCIERLYRRAANCYAMRLEHNGPSSPPNTALDSFTTTLLVSPYQNHELAASQTAVEGGGDRRHWALPSCTGISARLPGWAAAKPRELGLLRCRNNCAAASSGEEERLMLKQIARDGSQEPLKWLEAGGITE